MRNIHEINMLFKNCFIRNLIGLKFKVHKKTNFWGWLPIRFLNKKMNVARTFIVLKSKYGFKTENGQTNAKLPTQQRPQPIINLSSAYVGGLHWFNSLCRKHMRMMSCLARGGLRFQLLPSWPCLYIISLFKTEIW